MHQFKCNLIKTLTVTKESYESSLFQNGENSIDSVSHCFVDEVYRWLDLFPGLFFIFFLTFAR